MFYSSALFNAIILFGCWAIKMTCTLSSLAYCSVIYTWNVHTWAARNITWHYASSYEDVQNGDVILPVVFFFKARPKKNMTKERNPLEVLSFWSEHHSEYAPLEQVTALNQRGPIVMNADFKGCLHLLGRDKNLQVMLGCLEQFGWCFPTGPCSLESDTGLGWCRCLSKWSHSLQSSAHW